MMPTALGPLRPPHQTLALEVSQRISGPGAGNLVGVFVPTGGPSGAAPALLNFASSGIGTSFTSLSPLLDQVFHIGDGLTGNDTGTVQQFFVPSGAGTLYLGISDAGFYHGPRSVRRQPRILHG